VRRFGDSLAAWFGLPTAALGFDGWESALTGAAELMAQRAGMLETADGRPPLLIALIGGTPGYRELVPDPAVPEDAERIGRWLVRNVLRPAVPLFDEANRIVHEDPRIRDIAVYGSLLAVIAAGESSPAKIGGLMGRSSSSLSYQLNMLESAGFIERRQDVLMDRRPVITVADPMVRFHHLVIEPNLAELEAGRSAGVWEDVRHTVDSKILGPHFEALAVEWVSYHARDEVGLDVGATGQATVACREHKTSHEIGVLALERGARPVPARPASRS
jgi:hypothetical protein